MFPLPRSGLPYRLIPGPESIASGATFTSYITAEASASICMRQTCDRQKPGSFSMASQFIVGLLLLVAAIGVGCSSRATPIATVAAPTATHSPIATPAIDERSPTPILSPGPATSVGLDEMAFEYVSELSGLGPRESGTEQEAAAARYLASQFSAMGYSSKLQPFNVERFSVDQSGLALTGPESSTIEAVPLAGSAAGQANGVIVPLGLATASDFSKGGLEGKIALVRRGQITFQSKVDRAAEAGAAGVVIYNNRRGSFRGALPSSSMIPVMSIPALQALTPGPSPCERGVASSRMRGIFGANMPNPELVDHRLIAILRSGPLPG